MTDKMPVKKPRARGWNADAATPPEAVPAAVPTSAKPAVPATTTTSRPESSRPITIRLRESTEMHLDSLLAPLAGHGVDRTEIFHALIEAADPDSARAAVQRRRHRLAELA